MSSELMSAMTAAATGLRAQTVRIRISAENLANAQTTRGADGDKGLVSRGWAHGPCFESCRLRSTSHATSHSRSL
jgi:hypothetical protein